MLRTVALVAFVAANVSSHSAMAQESSQLEVAKLTDGSEFAASNVQLKKDIVLFRRERDQRELRLSELVVWGHASELRRGSYVLLGHGGRISGDLESITATEVRFHSARSPGVWRSSNLDRAKVRGIVFQSSADAGERERWESAFFGVAAAHDRLAIVGGDVLTGSLVGSKATAADDPESFTSIDSVTFLPSGTTTSLEIPAARVVAIAFAQQPATTVATGKFLLGLTDGSLLWVASLTMANEQVTITLADGQVLNAALMDDSLEPPESFWNRVRLLQATSPHVTYLSDLKAIGFKQVPLLDWHIDFSIDKNIFGARLRATKQLYVKGIGMPATSRLAYEIPSGAKRFEAEVAIDDIAVCEGSAIFRVYLEQGEGNWQVAGETKVQRGGDAPDTLRVTIGKSKRLALVVDMADNGDLLDAADWLNARFIK